jgi:hypothetical protein
MTDEKELNIVIERGSRFLPCSLSSFIINNIDADIDDFGDTDQDAQREPYTCDNRRFIPKLPTQPILDKYKIDLSDYSEICDKLEGALYISHCGMCI